MSGCVGFELAAIQRDVAEIEHAQRAGDHQYLHHQPLDLFQKAFAKGVQRIVIRMFVRSHKTKCNRVVGGVLQLATGKHACGIAVNQYGQQQCGVERGTSACAVGAFHSLQVQLLDNLNDKSR